MPCKKPRQKTFSPMNPSKDDNLTQFLTGVNTYADLLERIDDISRIIQLVYEVGGAPLTTRISGKVSSPVLAVVQKMVNDKVLPVIPGAIEDYFQSVLTYLRQIPKVQLTLAFEPSEAFIKRINSWVVENLGRMVLPNISVKKEIIAGVIIEYNGKYKDYSKADAFASAMANLR